MADTVKSVTDLKVTTSYVDDDTRIITIPNPVDNITAAQVKALKDSMAPVLIGDKAGAAFSKIDSAQIVKHTTNYLDIKPD